MCELIISVIDKGDDTHWVKRGTVIETVEDGHAYGADELANPMFRIIKLPGAPIAWGRAFMGAEIEKPGTPRQALHRLYTLNVDHVSIPAGLRAYLDDDTRAQSAYTVNLAQMPLAALAALKKARSYTDPTILGDPGNIIG